MLMTLDPSQIQAALNEFDEAIRNKGDKVRNVQVSDLQSYHSFLGVLLLRYSNSSE
jgi:hypothetical protein